MAIKSHIKLGFSITDVKREISVFVAAMFAYLTAHEADISNAGNMKIVKGILIAAGVAGAHGLFDFVLKDDSSLKN